MPLRRQKQAYDVRLREFNISPGDLVYKVDDSTRVGISKKLESGKARSWSSPLMPPSSKFETQKVIPGSIKTNSSRDRAVPVWVRRERSKFFSELDPMPTLVLVPDIQEEREPPEDPDADSLEPSLAGVP
jgi:hypothetical protein